MVERTQGERIAAIETEIKAIHSDIDEIKTDIKSWLNPRIEKLEALDLWRGQHEKVHARHDKRMDRMLGMAIGLFFGCFTILGVILTILFRSRGG